ncbi:DUF6882 domain-containing protein [Mucilaginibacter dorajii]|uniref:Uncharacterized protein n=1 Tax=Mucilaginibacter dorajii TaxID=692994 RepID=A0ABP7Q759_9SPHI|nr:DUF6882 domain-containing protein [Mucilaginibacter dorajii]MCS3737631.1 hypothetical protein [Mucilaginibacter dorajii]
MYLSGQSFEDYKDNCVADLTSLQPEFIKLHDVNAYEDWFYDHGTGAFHFKSISGKNLYFKYVDVGSFSTKTNTWNWAWDNPTTPKHVSRALEKVKDFGAIHNFEQLTTGLFEGDEYTGWEMTAIALKLLNAIGAYQVPHEHLFIYFIFTNELTQEQCDALKDKYIECDNHVSARTAFVCQHLITNTCAGFNEAFDSDPAIETEDEHQAWCNKCEKTRLKEGEWTEEAMAFANIKVVCDQCYFEIKERNQTNKKLQ